LLEYLKKQRVVEASPRLQVNMRENLERMERIRQKRLEREAEKRKLKLEQRRLRDERLKEQMKNAKNKKDEKIKFNP